MSVTNLSCGLNCSSVSSNGTNIFFTHNDSETITATFTYTANDGTIDSNVATVTVIITPVNDAPAISLTANDFTAGTGDSVGDVAANYMASDAELGALTVNFTTGTNLNNHYVLDLVNNTVEITVTALTKINNGDNTLDIINLTVTDSGLLTNSAVDTPNVFAGSNPPTFNEVAQSVNVNEDNSIDVTYSANDTDNNNALIEWTVSTAPNSGSVSIIGGSTGNSAVFRYIPNNNYNGSDTFSAQASSAGADINIVTSINIAAINDIPVANDDSGYSINEGSSSTTQISLSSLITGNDTDADGDTLTVTNLNCGINCSSVNSSATHIIFTHDGSETSSATFFYTANDGTIDSNIATVTIAITGQNDAPVADDDSGFSAINEGATSTTEISVSSLLSGDVDADGDSLSVTTLLCVNNCSNVTINGIYIAITHDGSESTSASFSYTANDGTIDSNIATVTIAVIPQNDAPVADNDNGYNLAEGATSTTEISLTSLLLGDSDAEGDSLSVINLVCVSHCTSVSNNGTHIVFQHDGTETSSASFSYTANDGAIDSNIAIVTININAINDTPLADNDSGYTINESATSNTEISLSSLLAGDTDGDGDTLIVTNLTCVLNCSSISSNATHVLFQHDGSETTSASFSYTANDGTIDSNVAIVSLIITPQNDAPIATNDSGYTLLEGATSTNQISLVGLLTNDSDAENAILSVTNLTCALNCTNISVSGIYIIFQHDGSETSTASFTYTANDGTVNSNIATATISITAVNDAPDITEGNNTTISMSEDSSPNTFNLTLNATDNENDNLTWNISDNANNGVASISSGTGSSQIINYIPSANFSGTDNFIVQVSDSSLSDTITVNVTIAPINDMPVITQVSDQTLLEGDTLTFTASVTDIDATDLNDGLGSLTWSITSGNDGSMTLSNVGLFEWTVPITEQFNRAVAIELTVTDGLENGTSAATTSFTLTVNPVDDDSDGVANYNDFCPAVADSSNTDSDGDGTAGTDIDANDNIGGDACDLDDDNDGMPDTFEDANQLDSKDASDAATDFDGDGVSNLNEFLAGTSPLLATLNISSTGYLTAYQLVEPDPTLFHTDATLIFADNYGPYRPGTHIIRWQVSNVTTFNLGTVEQVLNVNPLVSLSADQQTAEGATAVVTASINGDAVNYPVVVNYSITGTSDSSDHNAQDGVIMITTGNAEQSVSFNVFTDSIVEGSETVIFTIDSVNNAVKSLQDSHTSTILEGNVNPKITVTLSQNGLPISSAYIADGDITVSVTIEDPNSLQNHTISWLGSDSLLAAPSDTVTSTWVYTPTISGSYKVVLNVADNGSPSLNASINTFLVISSKAIPILLLTDDSDGDGIDDMTEGYDDSDNDGVPDYLDNINLSHLQVDQTIDDKSSLVLQTESGLILKIGNIARVSETSGTVITDNEIEKFGSANGSSVSNFTDTYVHIGGVYDFVINNLIPGSSAHLVIPLQIAIPKNAVYRKYTATNGWNNFIINANNQVYSAAGNNGACPEPLSSEYKVGLNYLDTCLQLKIEDGGENDQDNTADGRIIDPGVISFQALKAEEEDIVEEGGEIPFWLILMLSLLLLRKTNNK